MKWRYMLIPLALLTWWVYARQEPDTGCNRGAFIVRCENAVRAQLKAPATARFTLYADEIQITGERGTLRGTVDSENSFGAMLRTNLTCTGTPGSLYATLN